MGESIFSCSNVIFSGVLRKETAIHNIPGAIEYRSFTLREELP
jgi:hypothetical protein